MNPTLRRASFLAVLGLWALQDPSAFAQDRPSAEESEKAAAGATAEAPAGSETSEPPAAEGAAAATEGSNAPRSRTIEEIVVTAQRREEHLHDVPLSMSALDGGFMRKQGITDLGDVAQYVPNFRMDFSGSTILPRIRGFATPTVVTRGQEIPVGLAIDEVPYSRADYFVSGLFDLDRLEVLRGPQGQLFGANTMIGLLNLTTKNPTDEFTGFIDSEIGELDSRRFEGGIGGPLVPGFLNFRIAGLSEERDGYVENTTVRTVPEADKTFGGRLRRSGRVKLDFPDLFGGGLLLSYQRDSLDFPGAPIELTSVPARFRPLLRAYDPNVDFTPNNLVGSLDGRSFVDVNIDTFVARGHYDLAKWGLNTVVGWSRLASATQTDSDTAPWPATLVNVDELSHQATFELRVTSPDLLGFLGSGELFGLPLGSTDFTSGFFFQRRTQSPTKVLTNLNGPLVAAIQALNQLPENEEPPQTGVTFGSQYTEHALSGFEQTTNDFSGFGQMNWRFIDRWTLLCGMRLAYATKNASWNQTDSPGSLILSQSLSAFTAERGLTEFESAPKVGMKFDWTDNVNFYGTWSKNFQAAGFNNFAGSPKFLSFSPGRVQSWEAGTKLRLLDGAADLNLGLFWMNLKDLQLFTLDPTQGPIPITRIVNVGEARARGVESDVTWLPTEWLTLRGALGFNDTELLSFPLGTCELDRPNTDGDSEPRCDHSGEPLPQAPTWDISVTPSVRVPLTSILGFAGISRNSFLGGIDLTSALTVVYTDTQFLRDTYDPREKQPSFFLLGGNIGFGNASQGWSLQFRGENLTDVRTANGSFEGGAAAAGLVDKNPSPPRLVFGKFRWEF